MSSASEYPVVDAFVDVLPDSVNGFHCIQGGEDVLLLVVIQDGCSHSMVLAHSLLQNLSVIIFPLNQGLSSDIILTIYFGWVELYMV